MLQHISLNVPEALGESDKATIGLSKETENLADAVAVMHGLISETYRLVLADTTSAKVA